MISSGSRVARRWSVILSLMMGMMTLSVQFTGAGGCGEEGGAESGGEDGFCGDGICDSDESLSTCGVDCKNGGGGGGDRLCGNGVCDFLESGMDCPEDCNKCNPPVGSFGEPFDGSCDVGDRSCTTPGPGEPACTEEVVGENTENCNFDCGGKPTNCGDGVCQPELPVEEGKVPEDYVECREDCSFCGDGYCSYPEGEDAANCATDCACAAGC